MTNEQKYKTTEERVRIESAAKREREAGAEAAQICGEIGEMIGHEAARNETVTDCNHFGNAEKMREALSRILGIADHLQMRFAIPKFASEEIFELKQIAESALSAPPRNVDVGTAEEQYARVRAFFKRHKVELRCVDCPVNGVFPKNCALIWAQMPYEEGGAK